MLRLLLLFSLCFMPMFGFSAGKVLVVISSENSLPLKDGKSYPTGFYFNETIVPSMALKKAGYEVVFANPKGNKPTMDQRSDSVSFFNGDKKAYEEAKAFMKNLKPLWNPLSLSDVIKKGLNQYDAVFFPGGHAPMIDLAQNKDVGTILRYFNSAKKPTALICHGPISLLGAVGDPGQFYQAMIKGDKKAAAKAAKNWPYKGYRMTVFSTKEEAVAEQGQLKGQVQFYPQQALEAAGGKVATGKKWSSHVVQYRELITAQNPGSDHEFEEVYLKARKKNRS